MSDFTPQVETREIADSDLDNVSGGVLGVQVSGTATAFVATPDVFGPVSGLLNQVTSTLPAPVAGLLG